MTIHQASTPSTPSTGWSAADLMRVEFPPARWAVDGLIPEGLTILAGRPKIGKSWLVLAIAIAVGMAGRVLGAVKVQEGDVLYLALEDTGRRLQDRLGRILESTQAPARLRLEVEWPRVGQGGIERIDRWLKAHPDARLVIIDTLAKFRPIDAGKGSAYSADYAAIEPLQQLAGRYGVAIVVLHHQRKMGAEDWVDTISGTLGLAGAADGMIAVFRDRGSYDATMYLTGRDVEDAKHGLRWKPERFLWELIDAAEVRLSPERKAILDYLTSRGPATPSLIAAGLKKNPSTVRTLVQRMAEQDIVQTLADGRYAAPEPSTRSTASGVSTVSTASTGEGVDTHSLPSPTYSDPPVSAADDPPATPPIPPAGMRLRDAVDAVDSVDTPPVLNTNRLSTNGRSAVDSVDGRGGIPRCPTCGHTVTVAPGVRDDGWCQDCRKYVRPVFQGTAP